jgi:hypothetical protein
MLAHRVLVRHGESITGDEGGRERIPDLADFFLRLDPVIREDHLAGDGRKVSHDRNPDRPD